MPARFRPARGLVLAAGAVVALAAAPLRAADHEALLLRTDGMPVRLEAARFFDDGATMTAVVRNTDWDPVRLTLRIVVFDERVQLRGSVGYCLGEPLQPGTRRLVAFPLEVEGATTRDRIVVGIEEVRTPKRTVRVRESLTAMVDQARRAADLFGGTLTVHSTDLPRDAEGAGLPPCPCSCDAAAASGDEICGPHGLAAFTCSPSGGVSCSLGVTCK